MKQLKQNQDHPLKPGPELDVITLSKHHDDSDKTTTSNEV